MKRTLEASVSLIILYTYVSIVTAGGIGVCPDPTPDNGSTNSTEFTLDSTVQISCDAGYNLNGSSEIICQLDDTWDENPKCDPIDCGTVENITFGTISLNDENNSTYGSTANVACDTGYETSTATISCLDTGNWEVGICTEKACDDPTPLNGQADSSDFTYDSMVQISCDDGYNLLGNTNITCQANGTWNEYPTCDPKDCGTVENITFGTISLNDENNSTYGSTANVMCDTGYETSNATISCLDTGDWGVGSCTAKVCDDPTPVNGQAGSSDFTYNSMVQISCDDGYNLMGNLNITCQANSTWNEYPKCDPKDCGTVDNITFGTISLNDENNSTYGSTANVTCDIGYETSNATISCLETGEWQVSACTVKVCEDPTPVNGQAISSDFTYNSMVQISCEDGYNLMGNSNITCQANSTWNEYPTCDPIVCDDPVPANGQADSSDFRYNYMVQISCDDGYNLMGNSNITCQANGTWDEYPTCDPIDCGILTIENGQFEPSGGTTFGESAQLSCNSGYTISGVTNITCDSSGSWNASAACAVVGTRVEIQVTLTLLVNIPTGLGPQDEEDAVKHQLESIYNFLYEIIINDIRSGSVIVDYTVLAPRTALPNVALVNADLASGQTALTIFNETAYPSSMQVEETNIPVNEAVTDYLLCKLYELSIENCDVDSVCKVIDEKPTCSPIEQDDKSLILGLTIGIPMFVILVLVVCILTIHMLRKRRGTMDSRLVRGDQMSGKTPMEMNYRTAYDNAYPSRNSSQEIEMTEKTSDSWYFNKAIPDTNKMFRIKRPNVVKEKRCEF